PGSERLGLVAALAASLGRGLMEAVVVSSTRDEVLARIGPLSTLMQAVPAFCPELGPSETFTVPRLAGYAGPIAVVLGREGGVAGTIDALPFEAPPDAPPPRTMHLTHALGQTHRVDLPPI